MEENKTTKKFSMSEIANMNTLKPEEMEEAEQQANAVMEGESPDDKENEEAAEAAQNKEESKEDEHLVHTGETVSFVAKPTMEDEARFMFRHTYMNVLGFIGIAISIAAIVLLCIGYGKGNLLATGAMVFVAAMFTIISPMNILLRARKQAKLTEEGKAITFTFSDAGIDLSRGEAYVAFLWDTVFKVLEGKTGYYVYLSKNQAVVLPFASFEEDREKLKDIFARNLDAKRCKVK